VCYWKVVSDKKESNWRYYEAGTLVSTEKLKIYIIKLNPGK